MKSNVSYGYLPLGAIVYLAIIVLLTFSPAIAYFPFVRREWTVWLVGLVVSIFIAPTFFKTPRFYYFLLYVVILFLNAATGDTFFTESTVVKEIGYLILPVLMYHYSISGKKSNRFIVWVMCLMGLIIVVESIATFILDLSNPGIVRASFSDAVMSGTDRVSYLLPLYKLGMSSYSFPHALPILIPAIVYGIKDNSNYYRLVWWVLLVAIVLLCWLSASSTAFMLAFLSVVISFFTKRSWGRGNLVLLLLLTLLTFPFLFSESILLKLLDYLGDLVSGNIFFLAKVNDFKESIMYEGTAGDVESRLTLYGKSIQSFLSHPILGVNEAVGNHSSLLDRLSVLGLMGCLPLFIFLYKQFSYTSQTIHRHSRIFYYEGIFVGLLMLLLKDSDDWSLFLCLFMILPIVITIVDNNTKTIRAGNACSK